MKKLCSFVMGMSLLLSLNVEAKIADSPQSAYPSYKEVIKKLQNVNQLLGGEGIVLKINGFNDLSLVLDELDDVEDKVLNGQDAYEQDYIYIACPNREC